MAVIYEVSVHARTAIADDFLQWLRGHIDLIVRLPGFEGAELHALVVESANEKSWCVHYRLRDRAALDDYLRDHALQMRADGIARFGDGFRAERRVLVPLDR
jgi:hypothetical protein